MSSSICLLKISFPVRRHGRRHDHHSLRDFTVRAVRRPHCGSTGGRGAGLLHEVEAEASVAGVGRRGVGGRGGALRTVRVYVNVERFHETCN